VPAGQAFRTFCSWIALILGSAAALLHCTGWEKKMKQRSRWRRLHRPAMHGPETHHLHVPISISGTAFCQNSKAVGSDSPNIYYWSTIDHCIILGRQVLKTFFTTIINQITELSNPHSTNTMRYHSTRKRHLILLLPQNEVY
jgi:hypothetical protein